MIVYQCVRCGLIFKTKRQVRAHLKYVEKINNELVIDSYYQIFNLPLTKRCVRELL